MDGWIDRELHDMSVGFRMEVYLCQMLAVDDVIVREQG